MVRASSWSCNINADSLGATMLKATPSNLQGCWRFHRLILRSVCTTTQLLSLQRRHGNGRIIAENQKDAIIKDTPMDLWVIRSTKCLFLVSNELKTEKNCHLDSCSPSLIQSKYSAGIPAGGLALCGDCSSHFEEKQARLIASLNWIDFCHSHQPTGINWSTRDPV